MVSFAPLYATLKERGMKISDLRSVLAPDTLTNINKAHMTNKPKIYVGTIETICLTLGVPLEKVMEILPDSTEQPKAN